MLGGGGADLMRADDSGIDTVNAGSGDDVIDCGDGTDTVEFEVVVENLRNQVGH